MFAIVERALGGWACLLFLLSYALFGIDSLSLSCHAHVDLSTKTTPRSRSVVCCCLYFICFVLPMYSHCHRPFVRSSLSSSKSPGYFVFVWLFMCRFLFALLLVLLLWSVGWLVARHHHRRRLSEQLLCVVVEFALFVLNKNIRQ